MKKIEILREPYYTVSPTGYDKIWEVLEHGVVVFNGTIEACNAYIELSKKGHIQRNWTIDPSSLTLTPCASPTIS